MMAYKPKGYSATGMALIIILVLAALAAIGWQLGYFSGSTDEGMRTVYKAGVTDQSGGELIITDPEAPRIEGLTLPETAMTPVPPGGEASPTDTAAPAAE
jgi:hypothetical protein